ncbi:sce7726 family protein [Hymenobacter sp.]|uniref:sce7726 family protein n=1 Tax=Hymenobacter sp. TaxID=1898978 RepID=UPI00286D2995|nr:sce7726 family protein [Hymenobacter sp.]
MNDSDIRALLYPLLTGGVYVDELPTGTTRADVVHITPGFMHGYEVKGDRDTLQRVANQLRCYGEVYDFVTFAVTEKHLPKLLPLLPDWVGVLVASAEGLRAHRAAGYNATVERAPLARLLLLEDVKQFLMARGLTGVSTLRSREIGQFLRTTQLVPLASLAQYVRHRLVARLPERLLGRAERKAERARRPPRKSKPTQKRRALPGTASPAKPPAAEATNRPAKTQKAPAQMRPGLLL